jgi:hypothetical protein
MEAVANRRPVFSHPVRPLVAWRDASITQTSADPPLRVEDCEVHFVVVATVARSIRCDANDDGRSEMADAVWVFNELFRQGQGQSARRPRSVPATAAAT